MAKQLALETFTTELLDLYTETFENVQGMYLDRGTSLFETLNTISAEEASRPISAACASIAAQVEHVRFYLEVHEKDLSGEEVGKLDWGEIWRTVSTVDAAAWETSKMRLNETYQRVLTLLKSPETWERSASVSASMSIVTHSAYHLGEIRQALCTLKSGG